jgi:hypothetical protein
VTRAPHRDARYWLSGVNPAVLFAATIVADVATLPLFPPAPLLLTLAASATPLRRSLWRMTALWILAVVLLLIALAPFLLSALTLNFIDEGPVRTVPPG